MAMTLSQRWDRAFVRAETEGLVHTVEDLGNGHYVVPSRSDPELGGYHVAVTRNRVTHCGCKAFSGWAACAHAAAVSMFCGATVGDEVLG